METKNIMIVGVGGQGTLLASKLLGHLLCGEGFDVKVSEVHGMSQRGGSVVTYVRWGDCVASPIIDEGEADFVISFEKLEAARWAPRLRKGGLVIVNDRETDPMPVITGAAAYPHGVLDSLRERGVGVDAVDALTLACQAGSAKAVNLVLLGRLSRYFPDIPVGKWMDAIQACVKPRFVDMNKAAFTLGRESAGAVAPAALAEAE